MFYCTNCGQALDDGKAFCRFCGERQPNMQLINRLRSEAQRLRKTGTVAIPQEDDKQQETLSTLARLEKMKQEADEMARRRSGW